MLPIINELTALATIGQAIIYNNAARITSGTVGTESYWVVSGGNFTLKSESATDLTTFGNLKIESGASLALTSVTCLTVIGILAIILNIKCFEKSLDQHIKKNHNK